jgi:hypothetical protein
MKCYAQQSAFRSRVDREVQHGALQRSVNNALHFACGLFQDEEIVRSKKRHAGRLV